MSVVIAVRKHSKCSYLKKGNGLTIENFNLQLNAFHCAFFIWLIGILSLFNVIMQHSRRQLNVNLLWNGYIGIFKDQMSLLAFS
jgi:hypothetical protein